MRTLCGVVALLLHTVACAGPSNGQRTALLSPCRLDGLPEEIQCTNVSVPEDRTGASGRWLSIKVAVVPALARVPRPDPLVLLAGGPGQPATLLAHWITPVFAGVRRQRDIVLIDQRGTGASHALSCPDDPDDGWATRSVDQEVLSRTCLRSLEGDLRQYTNGPAMEDLEAIREALGYRRLNLWAGSYGTRAALVYMRAHPERVRSAVLDGVAPWSLRFPLYTARDGERALQRLLDDCAASPDCTRAFPALRDHLAAVLRQLAQSPAVVSLRDPRTGARRRLVITREDFGISLRGFLYVPALASAVPFAIERAHEGDYEPYLALRQAVASSSFGTMSLGMTRSVLCSEDVSRIHDDEVEAVTRDTVVGPAEVALWKAGCTSWPRAALPPGHGAPVRFEGPVLILSGELDPVVPPSWGEEVRALMPRARHLVAPGVGHNVTPVGCAPDLIAAFVDRADAAGIDGRCLEVHARPPFVTSTSGWRP